MRANDWQPPMLTVAALRAIDEGAMIDGERMDREEDVDGDLDDDGG